MRTLVLLILLAVHLPAHSQCTILPYSIPSGCNSTSCPPVTRTLTLWNPTINVGCADREYLTVTVNVDYGVMLSSSGGWTWTLEDMIQMASNYNQEILLYAEDQYGDMSLAGTGSFKDQTTKDFTVHGSTHYMFTFYNSIITGFTLGTSPLPYCKMQFGQNKILKADDVNSAQYQCSLFIDSLNQSIEQTHGLNGCTHHRCQYYADRKTVAFCESTFTDEQCYQKAEYVWFIGTEYDLSSLPKVMIYLTLLIIYFLGIAAGLLS